MPLSHPWRASRYRVCWGQNGTSQTRSRLRIYLGALLIANVALLVLVFRPPSRTLAEQEADLQRTRARHQSLLTTVQRMRELRSQFERAIQTNRQFPQVNFLHQKGAFSAMLVDLEQAASRDRLTPGSITYRME